MDYRWTSEKNSRKYNSFLPNASSQDVNPSVVIRGPEDVSERILNSTPFSNSSQVSGLPSTIRRPRADTMPSRSTVFPYVPLNDITTTTTTTNNNNNADMYSSIASKLSLPSSSATGGRHRSGSVTLPSDNTTNQGFGTTLFNSTSFSPYQIMEESASDTVASTLASLGLDDNTNSNNSNNHNNNINNNSNNSTGVNNITTATTSNVAVSNTTATISTTSPSTPTQHIQQRHRAYTVSTRTPSTNNDELSDLLSLNFSPFSPQTRSSVMQRPRAISLGMADDPHFDDDDNNTNLSRFSPFGMSSLQPTLSSVSQQQQQQPSTSSRLAQQYLSDTTTNSQQSLRISRSSGNLLDMASRNDFIENNLSDDINPMDDTMPSVSSSTSALLDSPSSSATQIPSRALWLGNINPSVSVNDLMQQFSLYGQVESARILSDKECGFVNFINVESAIAAKNDLETRLGSKLAGTSVRVGYGKADVTLAMALTNEAGPNAQGPTRALWVGNIPSNINTAVLHAIFQAFGPIESIRVLSHKNCGFINFEHQEDAVLARKHLQNKEILGPGTGTVRIGFAKAPTAEEMSNGDYVTFNTASSPQPLPPPLPLQPFSYYPQQQQQTTLQQRSPPPQPYMTPIYPGQHGYPVVSQGIIQQQQSLTMISPMMPTSTNHMTNYNYSSNNNNNNNNNNNSHNNNHSQQHNNNNNNNNKNNNNKNKNNNNNNNNNNNGSNSNNNVPIDTYQAAQWATAMMMTTMMMNASGQQPLTQPSLYTAITAERQFIMQQLGSNPDDRKQEDRIPISYYSVIPSVPELSSDRILEPLRLRDMRKRLESGQGLQDIEIIAHECMNEIVELCSDYIGNTVVQKLFEHCVDSTKHMMLERIAPYLAAIGVHKNGTWAAQKIIDYASTPGQIQLIRQHVAPYVPLLLLDQFGNYVVQCCLRMGPEHNQYIFDAIVDKCWEIGQGRFGARAVRAILENPIVTKKQQIYCAGAIAQNAVLLTTNANGTLLLIWLLDTSDIAGRYRVLCPRLIPHLGKLCTHKLGSLTVYKMIQQEEDKESSHLLLNTLASDANLLQEILQDQIHGVAFLQKVLALPSIANTKQRTALVNQIRDGLEKLGLMDVQGYKKLIEELDTQPSLSPSPIVSNDENSSTLDNSNIETEHDKNNTVATSPSSIIINEDTIQKETIENNNINTGVKENEAVNQQTSVTQNSSTSPPSSSTLSSPSTSSPSLSSSSSTMDMSMWIKNPQAVAMMANMYAAAMTAATASTTTNTTSQQQQQPTLPVNVPELPQFEHILKSLLPTNIDTNIKDSKKVVDNLIQQNEEKKDE